VTLPVSVVLAALEVGGLQPHLDPRPALGVYARAGGGLAGGLGGKGGFVYRLQPELVLSLTPRGPVDVYLGGGLGPVVLIRSSGHAFVPSASGVLGVRVGTGGGQAIAVLARAEGVGGGGVAATLDLCWTFGAGN
jgi:hypothetical protein